MLEIDEWEERDGTDGTDGTDGMWHRKNEPQELAQLAPLKVVSPRVPQSIFTPKELLDRLEEEWQRPWNKMWCCHFNTTFLA